MLIAYGIIFKFYKKLIHINKKRLKLFVDIIKFSSHKTLHLIFI